MPNNAVLVVAGDFKTEEAKQWIKNFGSIKRTNCRKTNFCRANTETIRATYEDPTFRSRWL
jgi:predicted Zn-dependent peptidase